MAEYIVNFGCEWHHVASGGKYEIVCYAISEASLIPVVIYKKIGESATWSRPCSEFFDGRFKQVSKNGSTTISNNTTIK